MKEVKDHIVNFKESDQYGGPLLIIKNSDRVFMLLGYIYSVRMELPVFVSTHWFREAVGRNITITDMTAEDRDHD